MRFDRDGWLLGARRVPSPNVDPRPAQAVELLVVHNISLPPGEFGSGDIFALFQNRLDGSRHPFYGSLEGLRVSAHFVVERDGRLTQCVPLLQRAWHAGVSCWQGRERCNDFSVGIELEGTDIEPYTDAQYGTLIQLVRTIAVELPIRAVVGHSDIAPGRKTDPGATFDWHRLHAALGWGAAAD